MTNTVEAIIVCLIIILILLAAVCSYFFPPAPTHHGHHLPPRRNYHRSHMNKPGPHVHAAPPPRLNHPIHRPPPNVTINVPKFNLPRLPFLPKINFNRKVKGGFDLDNFIKLEQIPYFSLTSPKNKCNIYLVPLREKINLPIIQNLEKDVNSLTTMSLSNITSDISKIFVECNITDIIQIAYFVKDNINKFKNTSNISSLINQFKSLNLSSNLTNIITKIINSFNVYKDEILAIYSDVIISSPNIKSSLNELLNNKDIFMNYFNEVLNNTINLTMSMLIELKDKCLNYIINKYPFAKPLLKFKGGSLKEKIKHKKDEVVEKIIIKLKGELNKHKVSIIDFYTKVLYNTINNYIKNLTKILDITNLTRQLRGINVEILVPYLNLFVRKIIFQLELLTNPILISNPPLNFDLVRNQIDKVLLLPETTVEQINQQFLNNYIKEYPVEITDPNYVDKLLNYLENIVIKENCKDIINYILPLTSIFEPKKIINLLLGLLPESKLEIYREVVYDGGLLFRIKKDSLNDIEFD